MTSVQVVALMASHDVRVIRAGVKALKDQSQCGLDDEIMAAGGVPVLVAALGMHAADAEVCDGACQALGFLAYNSNARAGGIITAGAVPRIVAALERHADNGDVCEHASYALYRLAERSADRKRTIVAAGAVPLLAAVCRDYNDDAEDWASDALDELGYNEDGTRR